MIFEDILRIASGLHQHDGSNADAGSATTSTKSSQSSLSLEQLVPVHKSLLETISITTSSMEEVAPFSSLEWFVNFITNPMGVPVENDNDKEADDSLVSLVQSLHLYILYPTHT